jgi:hypothetical protein
LFALDRKRIDRKAVSRNGMFKIVAACDRIHTSREFPDLICASVEWGNRVKHR